MTTSLAIQNGISPGELMERVIAAGDISKMEPEDRARYVVRVCESAGLNPLTKPFDLITLNGKLTLYATKGATDQLRKIHGVTLRIVSKERIDDVYMVTVEATTPEGRTDTDIGVVTLGSLKGDALANALMKALTKAKRRVTLSICGLGLLDESEFDTMPPRVFQGDTEDDAPPQPSRPTQTPAALHTATPVVEVVNADPEAGEIQFNPETATQKQITAEISRLRSAMGWTETDLADFAAAHKIGRNRAEALRMVSALQEMLDREYGEDEEPDQPRLLEADMAPINRWED